MECPFFDDLFFQKPANVPKYSKKGLAFSSHFSTKKIWNFLPSSVLSSNLLLTHPKKKKNFQVLSLFSIPLSSFHSLSASLYFFYPVYLRHSLLTNSCCQRVLRPCLPSPPRPLLMFLIQVQFVLISFVMMIRVHLYCVGYPLILDFESWVMWILILDLLLFHLIRTLIGMLIRMTILIYIQQVGSLNWRAN